MVGDINNGGSYSRVGYGFMKSLHAFSSIFAMILKLLEKVNLLFKKESILTSLQWKRHMLFWDNKYS